MIGSVTWKGNPEDTAAWRASEAWGGTPDMVTNARTARAAPAEEAIGGRKEAAGEMERWRRLGSLMSSA